MKRVAIISISALLFALFLVGCTNSVAQVVVTETPAPIETVVIGFDLSNVTPTPVLTPTIPIPTATPTATPVITPSAANGTLELTLEQLAQYNGKSGNPAYIAVDGVIYDVTNNHHWTTGTHEGYSAGTDLTDAIMAKSPHGISVLGDVPVVGKLIAG
jgi:predicted heme/steroid binding protein